MQLEEAFQAALLKQCGEAEALGCRMTRLRGQIEQHGALATVRNLLRRRQVSDGFDRLAQLGRLDLSVEALAVQSRFGALFSDDEVNACFASLLDAGYMGWK